MVGRLVGVEDVLLVEDNPAEIRFIEEALRTSEFDPTIHSTKTRGEAIDFVRRRGEYADAPEVDVILLDWHLSKTTGREVLEAAKAVDPPIPVVVMTGSKPELDTLESKVPEADRCIEKQTEPGAYIEILREVLTA